MKKFDDLYQVALVLGDGGSFNPDTTYETVEELVDALVELGNKGEVFVYHDDHLGLKDDLCYEFLNSSLKDIDEKFECQVERVLREANIIIPLSKRELSEDDIEDIIEDKQSRGANIDDYI